MRLTIIAMASFALLSAGCASTSGDPGSGAEAGQPGAASEGPRAVTQGYGSKAAPGSDMKAGGSAAAVMKDAKGVPMERVIYYGYDEYDIQLKYHGIVEAHAKYLRENPGARMTIEGNADERGSREYNVGLGQRRSDNVKKALLLLGVKESQIESVSLGEEKPACAEQGESCWWKNRRGDIKYAGE
ncbi:MAG TPA: peptidoglycan-associated lipoprotein Pal [Burkholderiales bacterium]|nr:peptidoglycan-associated lipoprotein Pal [Burkholderiales bacterium]